MPLNADDSIDFGRLEAQAATLGPTELDGLYDHGTAGEFQTLTEPEFDRINDVLAGTGKPFQLGASHPSAQRAGGNRPASRVGERRLER